MATRSVPRGRACAALAVVLLAGPSTALPAVVEPREALLAEGAAALAEVEALAGAWERAARALLGAGAGPALWREARALLDASSPEPPPAPAGSVLEVVGAFLARHGSAPPGAFAGAPWLPPEVDRAAADVLSEALAAFDALEAARAALAPDAGEALARLVAAVGEDTSLAVRPETGSALRAFQSAAAAASLRVTEAVHDALPALRAWALLHPDAAPASGPACALGPALLDLPPWIAVDGGASSNFTEDYVVSIDLGGDDCYANNAGGARAGFPLDGAPGVAVLIDLGGDDAYHSFVEAPSVMRSGVLGAGVGGVGVALDLQGDDHYLARNTVGGGPAAAAAGEAVHRVDASLGAGLGGVGVFVDVLGNDAYNSLHDGSAGARFVDLTFASMGAGLLGVGVFADAAGDDARDSANSWSAGTGGVFDLHVLTHGSGVAGAGVFLDLLGDDRAASGNKLHAAAAFELAYGAQGSGLAAGAGLYADARGRDVLNGGNTLRVYPDPAPFPGCPAIEDLVPVPLPVVGGAAPAEPVVLPGLSGPLLVELGAAVQRALDCAPAACPPGAQLVVAYSQGSGSVLGLGAFADPLGDDAGRGDALNSGNLLVSEPPPAAAQPGIAAAPRSPQPRAGFPWGLPSGPAPLPSMGQAPPRLQADLCPLPLLVGGEAREEPATPTSAREARGALRQASFAPLRGPAPQQAECPLLIAPNPAVISPANRDGVQDATHIEVQDVCGRAFSALLRIVDPMGLEVRRYDGFFEGFVFSALWDGRDAGGALASDALYHLEAYGFDPLGNLVASGVLRDAVTVDNSKPSVQLTSPADGAVVPTTLTVEFAAMDAGSGVVGTQCTFDGAFVFACLSGDAFFLSPGPHTLEVQATDGAGNVGSAFSAFTAQDADTTPPSIFIFNPPNGRAVGDRTVQVQFFASEPLAFASCSFDGAPAVPCQNGDTHTFDADGTHTLTVTGTDLAGNTGSDTSTFVVDTQPPEVTLTVSEPYISPGNSPGRKDTTTITVEATDLTTTFASVVVSDASGQPVRHFQDYPTNRSEGGGTTVSTFVWDGTDDSAAPVPEGVYTVAANVTDETGRSTTTTTTVTVDNTPPVIAPVEEDQLYISPFESPGVKDRVTFTTTIEDLTPVTWAVVIRDAEGAPVRTLRGQGNEVQATWDGTDDRGQRVPDGPYTITVEALDCADNPGDRSKDHPVIVDNEPPIVTLTEPAEGFVHTLLTHLVRFQADGTGTPVEATDCRVDEGPWVPCRDGDEVRFPRYGPHTLTVRARDCAGNEGSASTRIDLVPLPARIVVVHSQGAGTGLVLHPPLPHADGGSLRAAAGEALPQVLLPGFGLFAGGVAGDARNSRNAIEGQGMPFADAKLLVHEVQGAAAFPGLGLFAEPGGDDAYQSDNALAAVHVLMAVVRAGGSHVGEGLPLPALGFRPPNGHGVLADLAGDDRHASGNVLQAVADPAQASAPQLAIARGQGFASSLFPVAGYGGTKGVGLFLDAAGADALNADNALPGSMDIQYVQGASLGDGLGLLVDAGPGDDRVNAGNAMGGTLRIDGVQGANLFSTIALANDLAAAFVDLLGSTSYNSDNTAALVALSAGQGGVWNSTGRLGYFLDAGGDDRYNLNPASPVNATCFQGCVAGLPASALFLDAGGSDAYQPDPVPIGQDPGACRFQGLVGLACDFVSVADVEPLPAVPVLPRISAASP